MAILYTFYLAFPDVSFLSNSTTVPSSITDVGIVLPSETPIAEESFITALLDPRPLFSCSHLLGILETVILFFG